MSRSPASGRRPGVVCLTGPTASGKTALALWLAARGPFEIVSVDSTMVYRRMDIGTGKPGRATLARVPHWLIDIREPCDTYSAACFRRDAETAITAIHGAGRTPLLVGGSGMYFGALTRGLSPAPAADPVLRRALAREAGRVGWPAMHARLAGVDPAAAARIHPNDPQRVQRALEVAALAGMPLSRLHAGGRGPSLTTEVHLLGLDLPDRGVLHARIRTRFQSMLERGLVEEVRTLRADPRLGSDLPAMRAVGYRQVWAYLDGRMGFPEMVDAALAATRQLARRQLTWLRTQSDPVRFDASAPGLGERVLRHLRSLPGFASL